MKRSIYILNSIFLALILVGDICYINFGTTWLKGITSAMFVLLAVFNLVFAIKLKQCKTKFSVLLLIGLVFAMLGDILLEINFITGAILFAVGHVFFFISYMFLVKFSWLDLICGAVIFVPSVLFIVLAPIFNFSVLMEIVCVVYAIIISLMVGKAVSNLIRQRNLLNLIIVIGSALFFFSDLMLLLNVFAGLPRIADIFCLLTYYPAEFLLAHSIITPALYSKK